MHCRQPLPLRVRVVQLVLRTTEKQGRIPDLRAILRTYRLIGTAG